MFQSEVDEEGVRPVGDSALMLVVRLPGRSDQQAFAPILSRPEGLPD